VFDSRLVLEVRDKHVVNCVYAEQGTVIC
jgi:hypothetical protein